MNYKLYQQVFSLAAPPKPAQTATPPHLPVFLPQLEASLPADSTQMLPCSRRSSTLLVALVALVAVLECGDGPAKRRTKTGCMTCRLRKKKCDEEIDPATGKCTGCARNFLDCCWPASNAAAASMAVCTVVEVSRKSKKAREVAAGATRMTAGAARVTKPRVPAIQSKMNISNLLNDGRVVQTPRPTQAAQSQFIVNMG